LNSRRLNSRFKYHSGRDKSLVAGRGPAASDGEA
jgi:hypothetical protein